MPGFTKKGYEVCLYGTSSNGSLANLGTKAYLYSSASQEQQEQFTFLTGSEKVVQRSDWSWDLNTKTLSLSELSWTAPSGGYQDVKGMCITDSSDNVLVWFDRSSPITLVSGDTLTVQNITIQGV